MFISINGDLGSGKSTVCELLKNKFGFEIFSTGTIQRRLAKSNGISTLELNKISEKDNSLDNSIDKGVMEYANNHKGESIVFDSRMAWHFLPVSFKVRLTVDTLIAAERVYNNRYSPEESYSSIEEARYSLLKRQKSETQRFKTFYGVDIKDLNNYDLIVDTSNLTPDGVVNTVYEKYIIYCQNYLENQLSSLLEQNVIINTSIIANPVSFILSKFKDPYITNVDEILKKELNAVCNRNKGNKSNVLIDADLLVIESFESCSGKESTQRILYGLIMDRIQHNKSTILLLNGTLNSITTISVELYSLINKLFSFLP